MPKFKVGDVVQIHYKFSRITTTNTVHAIAKGGSYVHELQGFVAEDSYIWKRKSGGGFGLDYVSIIDDPSYDDVDATLLSTKNFPLKTSSPKKDYPHTCDHCNSPAYIGAWDLDCSNPNCPSKKQ